MTQYEVEINFQRAEETVTRLLTMWSHKHFTRDEILVRILESRKEIPNGALMEAFCFVVMAQRLMAAETKDAK